MDIPKKPDTYESLNTFLIGNIELIKTGECNWWIPGVLRAELDRLIYKYECRGWVIKIRGNYLNFRPKEGTL